MDNESLFSQTEEELFNKIKRVYNDINKNLKGDGINDSISEFSLDDTNSFSDDGLSKVSDISSIASFKFSIPGNSTNKFHTPQIHQKKSKKSRIPIYDSQRKKQQNSNNGKIYKPTNNNQNNKRPRNNFSDKFLTPQKKDQTQINIFEYKEPNNPKNFLIPELSNYSRACVCLFEGKDFPTSKIFGGERSTYAVIQLHPDILPIQTPISFNKTKHAIYNGGFDISINGLDFSAVTPVVSVYDYISEKERELIGISFIELHLIKHFDKEMCVFVEDEWVDIYALNNRAKTGKVKMTLIFHSDEKDVSSYIKKSYSNNKFNLNSITAIKENEYKLNNNEEDVDFVADDDEYIRKVNEQLHNNDKMIRNKNETNIKLESLGVQAEPEFQNEYMNKFQSFSFSSSSSSSSSPTNDNKKSNPFLFNVKKNDDFDKKHVNNFEFTIDEKENNQKKLSNVKYYGDSIIETDSLVPEKNPVANENENFDNLDGKHLKFIDESMLGTMGSILSNDETTETIQISVNQDKNLDGFCNDKNIKKNKRYTSYSDFHFMEENK